MRHANALLRLLGPALLASLALYPVAAQGVAGAGAGPALSPADSGLVAEILRAEDQRDPTAPALVAGAAHADARVRAIALRAQERIRDPQFGRRDSLPGATLAAPPAWPEPEWKPRYRALAGARDDCAALLRGLTDSVVAVQLRAAGLARERCAADASIIAALVAWVDRLPEFTARHARGVASWQLAAHGVVALARLQPDSARWRVRRLARHSQWHVRQYAARAAATLEDVSTLRQLVRDENDNVAEAAIEGLARFHAAADRAILHEALGRSGAQSVRAAAQALATERRDQGRAGDSTASAAAPPARDSATVAAASAALDRFKARANASERDVRVALLALLGRLAEDDVAPARPDTLFPEAVALALGAERLLQVTIDAAHGGGAFSVRLRGDVAPLMAARILALARDGFYDGTTWHRVEHDFVVQGGSPGANEYVGEARALRDELGTVPHLRGTVGMSTRGHDTGDAQWFINLRDNLRLGRDYTVFAEVVAGMDVVDALLEGDRIASIRPVPPAAVAPDGRARRRRP